MLISLIVAVVITVFAAYFATNNLAVMSINVLGYPIKGTTGIMMVAAFGGGVVIGVLLMLPALISRSWAVIRHRRKIQDLQDSIQRNYSEEEAEEE